MVLYYNYSRFGNFWSFYCHPSDVYDEYEYDFPAGITGCDGAWGNYLVCYGDGYYADIQESLVDRNGTPVLALKYPTDEYGKFETRFFALKRCKRVEV